MPPSISSESDGSWARILALRSLSTSSSTWGSIDWRSSATIEQSPFQTVDTRLFPDNLTRGGGAFFGSPNMHLITYLTWRFSRQANKDTANDTIWMAVSYHRTSSRSNIKHSPCQVYALFAVILNLKLPLPESNNRIRLNSLKSERGKKQLGGLTKPAANVPEPQHHSSQNPCLYL
jgi:hypothetical protein